MQKTPVCGMYLVQRYTWNMTNSIEGKYLLPFSCILLRMHATLLNGVQLEQSKDLRQFKGGTGPWEATEQQLTSFCQNLPIKQESTGTSTFNRILCIYLLLFIIYL